MAREQPMAEARTIAMTATPSIAGARRAALARQVQRQVVPRIVLILVCALFLLPFYWMVDRAQDHRRSARLSADTLADRICLVQFPGRRRVHPVLPVPDQHLHHYGA